MDVDVATIIIKAILTSLILLFFVIIFIWYGCIQKPGSAQTQRYRRKEQWIKAILMITSILNYVLIVFFISNEVLCHKYDCNVDLALLYDLQIEHDPGWWVTILVLAYIIVLVETVSSSDSKFLRLDRRYTWGRYEEEMERIHNEAPSMSAQVECYKMECCKCRMSSEYVTTEGKNVQVQA